MAALKSGWVFKHYNWHCIKLLRFVYSRPSITEDRGPRIFGRDKGHKVIHKIKTQILSRQAMYSLSQILPLLLMMPYALSSRWWNNEISPSCMSRYWRFNLALQYEFFKTGCQVDSGSLTNATNTYLHQYDALTSRTSRACVLPNLFFEFVYKTSLPLYKSKQRCFECQSQ